MALANLAELFYNAGLDVMMIDWDLEAPGLERFFFKDAEIEKVLDKPGIMDMLKDYKNVMSQDLITINPNEELPFQKPEDIAFDVYPDHSGKGTLKLLTAGRRSRDNFSEYANSVLNFDWQDFYDNWEGELYFEWLRQRLKRSADVVLIDSRTGVTEMGGVCTYQFADIVIMFCGSNKQNLDGTKRMAFDFKRPIVQELRRGRALNLIIVPSRVDIKSEVGQATEFYKCFKMYFSEYVPRELEIVEKDKFTILDQISINKIAPNRIDPKIAPFWQLKIPYTPYYSFKELIAVRGADIGSKELTDAYTSLAKAIQLFDPDLRDISKLIADVQWGNIKSKKSTIGEYRNIGINLVKNAKESIYITCIYPPEFWITGNYLFNWEELRTGDVSGERLINHFKNLVPYKEVNKIELQDLKYDSDEKNIINAKASNDLIFSIELQDNQAILKSKYFKKGSKEVKLTIRKDFYSNTTNIYSGNSDDLRYYREYFDLINERRDLNRIRILITDVYGNDADWKRDPSIVDEFVNKYNIGVDLRIGSIKEYEIASLYFGDLIIIDKKIAMMYDPNKAEPNGENWGRLQLVTGEIVDKYAELFESKIKWKKPEDYWEWRKKYIEANRND